MSVSGPSPYEKASRLQQVDGERDDTHQDDRKRQKVLYRGRAWSESDDDLTVQPKWQEEKKPRERKSESHEVFARQYLLERAKRLFAQITTLEEKIAQLIFYQTEALYDQAQLNEFETLVQKWQIGGILFSEGDYKRQSYLIEHLQGLSKTLLLVGNDFLHGLSFYFQDVFPLTTLHTKMTEQRYSDLGKAVMVQNRQLGVHFQFDRERMTDGKGIQMEMDERQLRAFRRGIRDAQGIVGKERDNLISQPSQRPLFSPIISDQQVHETAGVRTLNLCDLSHCQSRQDLEKELLEGLKSSNCGAFLLRERAPEAIQIIKEGLRSGKINESTLDRHVMKLLLLKAFFTS